MKRDLAPLEPDLPEFRTRALEVTELHGGFGDQRWYVEAIPYHRDPAREQLVQQWADTVDTRGQA